MLTKDESRMSFRMHFLPIILARLVSDLHSVIFVLNPRMLSQFLTLGSTASEFFENSFKRFLHYYRKNFAAILFVTGLLICTFFTVRENFNPNNLALIVVAVPCVVLSLYIILKHEIFGIKLVFEKQCLEGTHRAFTSGTSMLNHAIKNEIAKIAMCAENITSSNERKVENARIILESADYLMAMMAKIQKQLQDFTLEEKVYNLNEIIDSTLASIKPYIENKNISTSIAYDCIADIVCDKLHLTESLKNIMMNSLEAMDPAGNLRIHVHKNNGKLVVAIEDSGKGISKENLPHIFDPFFSTKKYSLNFGLGLSYCYNIMQLHGGSIDVFSEKNIGTTMVLTFPKDKIICAKPVLDVKEVFYGLQN
ncbi:MAG: HAMP domain-containing histidine kinase [Clostridia bacterium]|nr:HAMP domain-containing histidine kinase [Clostridia bacterium]